MSRIRENLVPPSGLPLRLSFQNLLFGIGRGAFLTGSAVYFTRLVGLQAWEIGVGLSLAAAVAMLTAVPLSALADRYGSRQTWLIGILASAALFALFPTVHGFWAFAALMVAIEGINTVGNAGRNVYMIEALAPETRVITQAFGRSWLNIGWGLGAAIAGVALAFDTAEAYHAMVYVNVAVMIANGLMILKLPPVARAVHNAARLSKRAVFRDRPFMTVAGIVAVLGIHGVVSLEVAPLWMITHTDAPKWILALATGVNTIMATTMQVAMTRGSHTINGARRVLRWAGWIGAASCPVFFLTGVTEGWLTVALLIAATFLITMSELWQSAAAWTFTAELAPADRRGEYNGASRMLFSAQNMVAPAGLIALAVTTGGWGWFVISGFFLAAALAAGPAVDWAARTRNPTLRATALAPEATAVG